MKRCRSLLISDKTFTDICSGKINYVSHALTPRWRALLNEEYVVFSAFYGEQRQKFKILKVERTIIKTIKIHIQKV